MSLVERFPLPHWEHHRSRWLGTVREYSYEDVLSIAGSKRIEYTLAYDGSVRLWDRLQTPEGIMALGAHTSNQAIQMVAAGLEAIYVSGWQVAAGANVAGQIYPDQSLYPANSTPEMVRSINNALGRADMIQRLEGSGERNWYVPLVADAEAGFGGYLNVYELMRAMIEAGAAGVHFEDQLASEKKCGHMGGKVVIPTQKAINNLKAARLAADVAGVPTVLIARTDANSAKLLSSDIDERDQPFLTGERTEDGFYRVQSGLAPAIARGIAYAPYADLIWCETAHPDLDEARAFADGVHAEFPDKMLAYNCSPSFNWGKTLDAQTIAIFQRELNAMGYKFRFVTLAGFHSQNYGMFELARGYKETGMTAYAALQQAEFAAEADGYDAIRHQQFAGAGYFDRVAEIVTQGKSETGALKDSTEKEQF